MTEIQRILLILTINAVSVFLAYRLGAKDKEEKLKIVMDRVINFSMKSAKDLHNSAYSIASDTIDRYVSKTKARKAYQDLNAKLGSFDEVEQITRMGKYIGADIQKRGVK